jgi:hypothetical protein
MPLPQLTDLLAAAPFLPHGKGALILILGGLAALPLGLLWSRASTGQQRWTVGLEQRAHQQGLGPLQILEANLHTCVVTLVACPSCRAKGSHAALCSRELEGLRLAVRPRAPQARVVEVGHDLAHRGSCSFLITRGPSP